MFDRRFIIVTSTSRHFPSNKTNDFYVKLPARMEFDGDWVCALHNISYPHSWSVLENPYVDIDFVDKTLPNVRIPIGHGEFRDFEEFIEFLNFKVRASITTLRTVSKLADEFAEFQKAARSAALKEEQQRHDYLQGFEKLKHDYLLLVDQLKQRDELEARKDAEHATQFNELHEKIKEQKQLVEDERAMRGGRPADPDSPYAKELAQMQADYDALVEEMKQKDELQAKRDSTTAKQFEELHDRLASAQQTIRRNNENNTAREKEKDRIIAMYARKHEDDVRKKFRTEEAVEKRFGVKRPAADDSVFPVRKRRAAADPDDVDEDEDEPMVVTVKGYDPVTGEEITDEHDVATPKTPPQGPAAPPVGVVSGQPISGGRPALDDTDGQVLPADGKSPTKPHQPMEVVYAKPSAFKVNKDDEPFDPTRDDQVVGDDADPRMDITDRARPRIVLDEAPQHGPLMPPARPPASPFAAPTQVLAPQAPLEKDPLGPEGPTIATVGGAWHTLSGEPWEDEMVEYSVGAAVHPITRRDVDDPTYYDYRDYHNPGLDRFVNTGHHEVKREVAYNEQLTIAGDLPEDPKWIPGERVVLRRTYVDKNGNYKNPPYAEHGPGEETLKRIAIALSDTMQTDTTPRMKRLDFRMVRGTRMQVVFDRSVINCVTLSDELAEISGFGKHKGRIFDGDVSTFAPDLKCGIHQFIIYETSGVLGNTVYGDELTQVLRFVTVSGKPGEIREENYDNPTWVPVLANSIDGMHFQIRTPHNKKVMFQYGGITMTIVFRRSVGL